MHDWHGALRFILEAYDVIPEEQFALAAADLLLRLASDVEWGEYQQARALYTVMLEEGCSEATKQVVVGKRQDADARAERRRRTLDAEARSS